MSPLMQWLALRFCDWQVAGSIPVGGGQGYELFGEIILESRRFHLFIIYLYLQLYALGTVHYM